MTFLALLALPALLPRAPAQLRGVISEIREWMPFFVPLQFRPPPPPLALRTSRRRMSNKLLGEERVERRRLLVAVSVLVLFVVDVVIISRSIAPLVIKCRFRRRREEERSQSRIVTESHLFRRHFNHDCKLHQLCARSLKMQSPAAAAAVAAARGAFQVKSQVMMTQAPW